MRTTAELTAEIERYRKLIEEQERIAASAPDTMWGRMDRVHALQTITDYADRLARLERRLTGTPEPGATMEQVRLIEYVNSRAYDNE